MSKDHPRPLTVEDMRWRFLNHVAELVKYWQQQDDTAERKVEGAVFSVLAALDGASVGLPGYMLIPCRCEQDEEYAKQQGFDYEPCSENVDDDDIGGSLHEQYYPHLRGEVPRPSDFYDFADRLTDDAKRFV